MEQQQQQQQQNHEETERTGENKTKKQTNKMNSHQEKVKTNCSEKTSQCQIDRETVCSSVTEGFIHFFGLYTSVL